MTVRLSSGLRKALLGDIVLIQSEATYTLVDGGAGDDTITSSANNFITKGFHVGQTVTLANCTTGANDGSYVITGVAAGTLSFATGSWTTGEVFAAATTATANDSGSFADIFSGGCMRIYSGSQPVTADAAETGTLLIEISLGSATFVPATGAGSSTYGLQLQMMADNSGYTQTTLSKKASETWSGVAIATGTAGYARLYDKRRTTGASYTARRIDLGVATSGSQVTMPSVSIVAAATTTLDACEITLPY